MAQRTDGTGPARLDARADFLAGAAQVSPIVVSVVLYGLLFGALAGQAGLSPLEVVLMSGLVFSGAAQFVAVDLWSSPVAVGTVAAATLLVGSRHVLMGATLAPGLSGIPAARAYGALFFMVDEAWALSLRRVGEGRFSLAFYAGLCAPLYLTWLATTGIGAAAGTLFARDPARYGVDVVFTAVFVVLLAGLWKGKANLLPWTASAAAAIASERLMPGAWYIFVGGVAGVAAAALTWRPSRDR